MADSPSRKVAPISGSSRLLQSTTSTVLKAKDSTSSPIQRDSLSFHAIRAGSPMRRSDSPSQRTQSPRCRAEAYALHFQGNGVGHLFGTSSLQNSRSNSPATAPAVIGSGRAVRRLSPHREDSMFGSECPSAHRIVRQASAAIAPDAAQPTTRHPGLWTRKDGGERVSFTGSRRHFSELQQANVVGQSSMPSSPAASHYRSLESTLDAAEVVSVGGSDYGSVGGFNNGYRSSKRILDQSHNISGSSCHVAQEQFVAPRGKLRDERFSSRKTAPFDNNLPVSSAVDGGSAPSTNAPMMQEQRGKASVVAAHTNAAQVKSTILDYRESGWKGEAGMSRVAAQRRERAPVEGHANNTSRNVTNLSSHTATEVGERPASIKTMAGPPVFVPPPMRAPSPLGQRLDSPFRAKGQNGTFSISSMASAAASMASSPAPSGASTPRLSSPIRAGRGVGLYSPLRQSSLF